MPELTAAERRRRAVLAANLRHHPDAPATEALVRDFRASRLADHIRTQVDKAPPLTVEQREELARILRPSTTAGGTA